MGGAMAVNCSKSSDNGGVIHIALNITPGGPAVNSVHWQIMSSTNTLIKQGDINTSDLNATPSVDTSCPAGSGDTVVLTATATDGTKCNGQSMPFNVIAGQQTPGIGVQLICGGGTPTQPNGSVIVNGTVIAGDNCPLLTAWEASPLQTTSGAQINVSAAATDADVGQTVSYAWTTSDTSGTGTFAMPTSAVTTYTCGAPGTATLTVTASDNYMPTPCTTAMTFPINCVAAGKCGNGIIEAGETCDPPNGTNCNANCQHVQFCGDGIIDPPETCEPPNTPSCSATCQKQAVCGNNIVEPGEFCDPPGSVLPDGLTCNATCTGEVFMCSQPNTCTTCEQADTSNCPAALNTVPGATAGCYGCEGFATAKMRADCAALLTCVRTQGCMAGDDPTPCLCDTLTAATCSSSGPPPTAKCLAQYNTAAADASGTVFSQFGNPSTPVGIANNQAACRVDSACASCP